MTITLHVACSPGEIRAAAWDGRSLHDFALSRPGAAHGVGDIYRGRVVARVRAMAGAFVDVGGAEGFLPDSAGGANVLVGAMIRVRVSRAPQGGKGPRLAIDTNVDAGGSDGGPGRIRRGPDALDRLAARYPGGPIVIDDAHVAAIHRATHGPRIQLAAAAFDDSLAAAVAALAQPVAALPGGAWMNVTPTPALVAIDVDLGAASAERRDKATAQAAANAALVPALTTEIRLRDLGGAILVDFGGMPARRRATLGPPLAAALAEDPLSPRLLGFTALGLAEILRPRVHAPLHELLTGPHAAALSALRAAEAATRTTPGRRPRVRAAPPVAAAIDADTTARGDFRRRTGHDVAVLADPTLPAHGWTLVDDGDA